MAQLINVRLNKGDASNLGFRLQGGKDFGTPLLVQKVNFGSPAEKAGLLAGDSVVKINATDVFNLRHKDAQDVIIRAGPSFEITVQRGGSTWKPTVTPLPKSAVSNNYSPVTQTSLAAKPQPSIGAIGTGHNLSAQPFNTQLNGAVNGGPKLVNKQYNSPVGLYSEQSIAETLSAQSEVLSTGVLGVNFKKNEKNYEPTNSEVFRMVHEADKEPRDEPEPDSGVVSVPFGIGGLKHIQAPENKPIQPQPQLPPGQNICAECERLIVGVFVRIKDKNLHVECFKCSTCGSSLKNVGYYNINHKLYCDVHAKLAARNNPPAPNLVPVTLPPGGKAPVGTISAALASHPLPVAPLSPLPSSNLSAQPFQQNDETDFDNKENSTNSSENSLILDTTNLTNSLGNIDLAQTNGDYQNSDRKFFTETKQAIGNGERDNLKARGPVPFSTYMTMRGGTNFSSPRPFSSVSAPLSPPVNNYATLPKTSPTPAAFASPAPASGRFSTVKPAGSLFKEKGHSLQNIIWPPPPSSNELELPTATPLYFPPSTHIRIPTPVYHPKTVSSLLTDKHSTVSNQYSATSSQQKVLNRKEEYCEESLNIENIEKDSSLEAVEFHNIAQNMEAKMSICSSEVTSYTERQMAVETIETAAETHRIIESVLQARPKSPPPTDKDLQPRVEVETIPLSMAKSSAISPAQVRSSTNEPRVVTRVCVCTNSCCNANTGELCESCPMRELRRPKDYQKPKLKPVENSVPKRYGSPVITGVSVTINNPGRIKEAVKDLFTQIPDKRTRTALGAALATAPTEPFTPVGPSYSNEPVSLPEETKPYLPPERPIIQEPKQEKPPKEKPQKPDTPFASALRIAPDRPFTPVDMPPAPVKKKKPKEDPLLKDLPKPTQWISMRTALTTASDRAYSPLVCEVTSSVKENVETGVIYEEEINRSKETRQKILKRSVHNETILPKPFTKPVRMEKFDAVNDDRATPQMQFPPISGQLKAEYEYKADYSEVKSEISSQIIEQAHLDEQTVMACKKLCDKPCREQKGFQSEIHEEECIKKTVSECRQICSKSTEQKKEEKVIEKQTEETILKKPLELAGYLHKPEYLPQYQIDLRYDETIQLPHHKDIKKLLPSDQNKNSKRNTFSSTQGHSRQTIESQYSTAVGTRQTEAVMKPVRTIEPGDGNVNIPQVVFQPVSEDPVPRTTFSPRPGSLTPSMINKPPPTLPYYQSSLVPQHMPAPETNLFDPKSPAVSRSPSPCPERAASPSPFGRLTPRPVTPAAGPPPNPLQRGQPIPQFRKEDRLMQEAKKNISEYLPQYREKVDCIEFVQPDEYRELQVEISKETTSNMPITVPSINKYVQNAKVESCSFEVKKISEMSIQETSTHSESIVARSNQQQSAIKMEEIQAQKSFENLLQSCKAKVQEIKPPAPGEPHKPTEHPFKNVNNPDITDPGVAGMHITNPQRIVSPFLSKTKVQAQQEPPKPIAPPPPPRRISQTLPVQRRDTQPLPIQRKNTEPLPIPRKASLPKIQNTTTVSSGEPSTKSIVNPSTNKSTTSAAPGVSASVPPTVSQTNTGAVGGRQSGAIGVAPKRGRGVLNVGGLIGSRVPMCGCCHGQIRGPFITALGKIWCPEHFVCSTQSCRRQLQDLGFVEEQGQLYCEYCFEQYIAPPCSKCGIKVKGDCLKAIGKNFHPECFNCAYCGKLFANSPFFLEDGQPYCENDWNELFTTKCFACGFPVEAGDRWVEALNNNYHSQCFNCTMCKKNLEGQSFFAKGGRPFCKNHAR